MAEAAVLERIEASVNSNIVFLSDVKRFRQTLKLRAQLDPLFSGTALATKADRASNDEIVDFLIDEAIVLQQYPVTDAEVEQAINSIQAQNHIERSSLKKALGEQGFKFEDYFELIRSSVAKRNLIDRDIRTKVTITDDDIKNYFYNHYSKASGASRAYTLRMITVSTSNYKNAQAAKDTALRAQKDLRGGDSMEEVAKRSADDGEVTDLGTVTEDQMSAAIRGQVKKLRIGEVSDVFGTATSGAFYILKLLDVRSDDSSRLDKLKPEIESHLMNTEYQHQIQLWIERQRQTAFIHRAGEKSRWTTLAPIK